LTGAPAKKCCGVEGYLGASGKFFFLRIRTVLINHQVYRVTITKLQNIIREMQLPHMRGPVHFGTLGKFMRKRITASMNLVDA
jgi:hypothetical protein